MTEEEWRKSMDPQAMTEFLRSATTEYRTRWQGWISARRFPVSERKWRLFLCACCRRIEWLVPSVELRAALRVIEGWADGGGSEAELDNAVAAVCLARKAFGERDQGIPMSQQVAFSALFALAASVREERADRLGVFDAALLAWDYFVREQGLDGEREESARQADLLREVIGNPFRAPFIDPGWLTWNNRQVVRLAETLVQERAFEQMPVLADALEDAGCTDEEILGHCRQDGHVLGCWLVERILDRS
jgi:hypothetical protein